MNEYEWMMQFNWLKWELPWTFPSSFVSLSLCCLFFLLAISHSFIHSFIHSFGTINHHPFWIPSLCYFKNGRHASRSWNSKEETNSPHQSWNHIWVFSFPVPPILLYSSFFLGKYIINPTVHKSVLYIQLERDCSFTVYQFNSWDFKLLKQYICKITVFQSLLGSSC